jgi:hypothetical protein
MIGEGTVGEQKTTLLRGGDSVDQGMLGDQAHYTHALARCAAPPAELCRGDGIELARATISRGVG